MPAMALLTLRPGVSFAPVGTRLVFLDLGNDRYCALPPAAAETLAALRSAREPADPDYPDVRRLLATGLFALNDSASDLDPVVHHPAASGLGGDPGRGARFADLMAVARLLVSVRRQLRPGRLEALTAAPVPSLRRGKDNPERPSPHELAERFRAARRLLPLAPRCLRDSLALRAWLDRHGRRAMIVFGVTSEPFAAHCWLECDGVVLNDAPDRIASFVPVGVYA